MWEGYGPVVRQTTQYLKLGIYFFYTEIGQFGAASSHQTSTQCVPDPCPLKISASGKNVLCRFCDTLHPNVYTELSKNHHLSLETGKFVT